MYYCVYACAQARAHTFASDWHREIIWTPTDQPMERGAHTVASERARWTSQTVAPQPDEHTRTADRSKPAFSTHECPPSVCPSLHHLLLPFTLFAVLAACALRVRPPSLIGQRADRMGTMGGELERWVPQPVRRRLWAAGTLLSPQIVSLQLVHRGLLTGSSTSALL